LLLKLKLGDLLHMKVKYISILLSMNKELFISP
jgi:hypothetical protein